MADVFISYKREERPLARLLADALEFAGLTVWWDPKLRAGQRFDDVIENAIIESRCVIVLWTELAVSSTYVRDEALLALELDKLLPVSVDNTRAPMRFRNLHTIPLSLIGASIQPNFMEVVDEARKKLDGSPPDLRRGQQVENDSSIKAMRKSITGSWSGVMPGVKLSQSLTLLLPAGVDTEFEASMQVTYSVRDLVFLVEEVFDARLTDSVLELRGKRVEYVTPAKVREYFLDVFELRLSDNKRHLVGSVEHSRGKHRISFTRDAPADGGDA